MLIAPSITIKFRSFGSNAKYGLNTMAPVIIVIEKRKSVSEDDINPS
ncbi:MAG: hypothetical protein ACTSP9_10460 [Promethearchaeota archaeon]